MMSDTNAAADATDEQIDAYTPTPEGAVIRLRGLDTPEGWVERVEVVDVDPDADPLGEDADEDDVTVLFSGRGMEPTAVYNQTIQAFVEGEN